jgi:DNA repair protein RadC
MEINLTEEQRVKVINSDVLYSVMQRVLERENLIDRNKEHFWTVGLNVKNTILYIELISLGGTSQTIVEPMQVFRVGVLKGAVKMILVHNHPSNELKPSEADKDITDRLVQVGNILQIEVIDHLIIAEKSFLSFEDIGLLAQIRRSTKYVPAYELEAKLRKEAENIREEGKKEGLKAGKELGIKIGTEKGLKEGEKKGKVAGEKQKALEVAKFMKKQGEPMEKIMLYTGLSEVDVINA